MPIAQVGLDALVGDFVGRIVGLAGVEAQALHQLGPTITTSVDVKSSAMLGLLTRPPDLSPAARSRTATRGPLVAGRSLRGSGSHVSGAVNNPEHGRRLHVDDVVAVGASWCRA